MEAHYTYLHSLGLTDPNAQKFVTALALGSALLFVGATSARALSRRRKVLGLEQGVVPEKKITTSGIFDLFMEGFVSFQDSILGKEGRKYVPLTATIFLYTLVLNMIGLIPGMPAPTTTVWITVPLGIFIFFAFNYYGVKEQGLWHYLKHFAGPVWWLAWFFLPLEIMGAFLRILTINLRLYWNITADHIVLGLFTELVQILIPVVFLALGTFVCFMQAFVPTILTMIYILLATQHEESEGHH
jgi:F-type H+-transporting ATPase subunit a